MNLNLLICEVKIFRKFFEFFKKWQRCLVTTHLLYKTEVDAGTPQVTTGHSKLLQEAAGNLPAVF
jgi:hypothetical protein